MQRAWYYVLRAYVRIGLFFFYRKLVVRGVEQLPPGPILFTPNHQNAFMDALLIVCTDHRFTYFLARADIFKKRWARWFLTSLNLLPVFRLRDGLETVANNQQTFDATTELFARGHSVIIFPEGNHGSQRRVRALSKGFTRVVFDFVRKHPNQTIHIVPVGLNYEAHRQFRSSVSILYGQPIAVTAEALVDEKAKAQHLRLEVAEAMKKLTTHIEDAAQHDAIVRQLDEAGVDYLDPKQSNALVALVAEGTPLTPVTATHRRKINPWWQWLHAPPLAVWKRLHKRIKDPVFVASLKFAFGLFVVPVYYMVVGALLFWAASGWVAAGVCALLIVSTLVTVRTRG